MYMYNTPQSHESGVHRKEFVATQILPCLTVTDGHQNSVSLSPALLWLIALCDKCVLKFKKKKKKLFLNYM